MSERSRPLPRLQELWRRGVSVHHGVPLLRHADPEARAQARSRRRAQGCQAREALAPAAPAAAPERDPRVFALTGAPGPSGCSCSRRSSSRVAVKSRPAVGWRTFTYGAGFDEPVARVHRRRSPTPPTGYEAVARRARSRCSAGCSRSRHGWWAPLLVFFVCGVGRRVRRRRGRRRGHRRAARTARRWACSPPGRCATCSAAARGREDDSDLLGVLAIAAVLVLLPLAATEASRDRRDRRRRRPGLLHRARARRGMPARR